MAGKAAFLTKKAAPL